VPVVSKLPVKRRRARPSDVHLVATSVLLGYCNPFRGCWRDISRPIGMDEVTRALGVEDLELSPARPFSAGRELGPVEMRERRLEHASKIAWFVRHGFQDAIEVDVGVPSLGCHVNYFVVDGNHRFSAAVYRHLTMHEDPILPLSVGGSVDYAKELGLWPEAA
jgi:predicted small secreted protein